jgi:Uma2 family endonuclease
LHRWEELLADPALSKIQGRIETDRHGRITMSLPPSLRHGRFQHKIQLLLEKLMPPGEILPGCPVSTADGIKAADVAWASPECWRELGNRTCFVRAPEICVEVLSPSNSEEEIREKMALYFDASAREVWTCDGSGKTAFSGPARCRSCARNCAGIYPGGLRFANPLMITISRRPVFPQDRWP